VRGRCGAHALLDGGFRFRFEGRRCGRRASVIFLTLARYPPLHRSRLYGELPRENAPNPSPLPLEQLNDPDVDADLWALLQGMIAGVGGEWRVEDLDATGRLYEVSATGAG
jgi:hypothetical protein